MILANTLGKHKKSRCTTWHSPDGHTANQIDYILIDRRFRSSVCTSVCAFYYHQTMTCSLWSDSTSVVLFHPFCCRCCALLCRPVVLMLKAFSSWMYVSHVCFKNRVTRTFIFITHRPALLTEHTASHIPACFIQVVFKADYPFTGPASIVFTTKVCITRLCYTCCMCLPACLPPILAPETVTSPRKSDTCTQMHCLGICEA